MGVNLGSLYVSLAIFGGAVFICLLLIAAHLLRSKCKQPRPGDQGLSKHTVFSITQITEDTGDDSRNPDGSWNRSKPFSKMTLGTMDISGVTIADTTTDLHDVIKGSIPHTSHVTAEKSSATDAEESTTKDDDPFIEYLAKTLT